MAKAGGGKASAGDLKLAALLRGLLEKHAGMTKAEVDKIVNSGSIKESDIDKLKNVATLKGNGKAFGEELLAGLQALGFPKKLVFSVKEVTAAGISNGFLAEDCNSTIKFSQGATFDAAKALTNMIRFITSLERGKID